ncbi:MAG: glycosyltransferase family 4 protein [Coriobacteriia bacterium]
MAIIGIDVTALSTPSSGGIGTSQYQTMRALARLDTPHDFIMYAAAPPVIPFSERPLDVPWPLRLGHGPSAKSNIVWMQTGVNRLLAQDGVDLFWSPRHILPFRAKRIKRVATIQDFWHLHFPGQQPLLNRTTNRILIDKILRVSDHIVCASQATADDAIARNPRVRDSITVVPLGVDATTFRRLDEPSTAATLERLGVRGDYLLSLDVFNPRKNFANVVRAFSALPAEERRGLILVGIGRRRETAADAGPREIAAAHGVADALLLLDDVGFDDLVALYSGAFALVYPSVYEGFGMPVLEAMACGCPVITSDRSSLPQVAGDAALLADPDSSDAIASAIRSLIADPQRREGLVAAGLERASTFTWERTAKSMLDVFDRVLIGAR